MRRKTIGSLILVYLQVHLGDWVNQMRLAEIADNCQDAPRALRTLRADGWPLDNDRHGNWRLRREERGDPRGDGRSIPARMRVAVLERDGSRCRLCGIGVGDINLDGRPTRLQADHIVPRDHGGETTMENLRALCHVCNHDRQNGNAYLVLDDVDA